MMMFISLTLLAMGLCLIVWNARLARFLYRKVQLPTSRKFPQFIRSVFGDLPDSESHWMVKMNRFVIVVAGIVLLLAAFTNYFGSF